MAIQSLLNQTPEELILTPRGGDRLIRINISRNTLIALIFSVLIHVLILLLAVPKIEFSPPESARTTIEVSLAPPKQAEPPPQVEQVVPDKPPEPVEEPVKKPKTPKVMTQQPKPDAPPPAFKVPDVIATPKPSPAVQPPPETVFPDMQSYMKAQQAKRQGAEWEAARQNAEAVAKEVGPSEEEIRDQRIAKNLQGGAGGTFTLTSLSGRRATFSFNGWVNSLSNQKQQYFEVEANSGQDVRVLMIKQVISFIRESYQGDFPWDSKRLGKVITLSARPEDNSSLEDFLMTEFFGSNYRNS